MIYIIGLGPSNEEAIRKNIKEHLLSGVNKKIIVRTEEHPAVKFLKDNNIKYVTCDKFYLQSDNFQTTYENIANYILEEHKEGDVCYLVPGHPMVAELTTKLVLDKEPNTVILGGESFLDSCFNLAQFDPVEGFQLADATNNETLKNINPKNHILITQCYDDLTAANVSVELDKYYPYDYEVTVLENVGLVCEKKYKVHLYELATVVGEEVNNLRTIYIPANINALETNIKNLLPEPQFYDEKDTDFLINEIAESLEKIRNFSGEEKNVVVEEELANILYTIFDFENASDEYYELNNVLQNLAKKVLKNG